MREFWFGVSTSLLATAIWTIAIYVRRTLAIRDLRGVWIEIRRMGGPNPNKMCFLELRYSFFQKRYLIRGVVYNEEWFCEAQWVTMNCSVSSGEEDLPRIFYSYSGSFADSPFMTSHGYGLINLGRRGKRTLMKDGYFMDAQHSATTPAACDYFNVTSVPGFEGIASIGDVDPAVEKINSPLRQYAKDLLLQRKGTKTYGVMSTSQVEQQ